MSDKVFLDTNILVYLANQDSPFHASVKRNFTVIKRNYELWISRQVLREYAAVMTRETTVEKPLSPLAVVQDIRKFEKMFFVADETEHTTIKLLQIVKKYSVRGK